MSFIWDGDKFAWEFVAAAILVVVLILSCDYAWRMTGLTGRSVLVLGGAGMLIGVSLIYLLRMS